MRALVSECVRACVRLCVCVRACVCVWEWGGGGCVRVGCAE